MRTPDLRSGTLENLQTARALAALVVVGYHIGVLPFGECGVDVFFVISGFIMSHVAPREGNDFLRKRLIRIIPLYWLSTVGVYAIAIVRPWWLNTTTAHVSYLAKSLLFIPYIKDNGHWGPLNLNGWTLEYEMLFYLVVASALVLVKARYATIVAASVLATFCVLAGNVGSSVPTISYLGRPLLLEFGFGVVCYWIVDAGALVGLERSILACLAVTAAAAMPFYFYAQGVPDEFGRVWAYGLPSFLLIASIIALEEKGWSSNSALLRKLGAASYSIYLLHPYVIGISKKVLRAEPDLHSWSGVGIVVAIVAVVCVFGHGVHLYIEKPMLARLNRCLTRSKTHPLTTI